MAKTINLGKKMKRKINRKPLGRPKNPTFIASIRRFKKECDLMEKAMDRHKKELEKSKDKK